jgi:hypothetical protein
MDTTNTTNTTDSRKFLDYKGLETFWGGIKAKLAEKATVDDIDRIDENINKLSGSFEDSLEKIYGLLSSFSPLSADTYRNALAIATDVNTKLGSVIYVKNDSVYDGNTYNAGPYIVTDRNSLLYINTYDGKLDLENFDWAKMSQLIETITRIETEFESFKNDYVPLIIFNETVEELRAEFNATTGNQLNIKVVEALPEEGIPGTIYLVPLTPDVSDAANYRRYEEYICIIHEQLGIIYEQIGIDLDDLKDYVKSNDFNETIASINETIAGIEENVIVAVKSGITSYAENSIGEAMAITTDEITDLLNKSN